MSIDAYRGLVMLAMASGGFGFASILRNHPEVLHKFDKTMWQTPWTVTWQNLAFHFDHVAWLGCGFWDLIQPSFMFLVGVALPFSLARREADGQTPTQRFVHVLIRSFVLVALGVFLSSNWSKQTNFTFVNVLTQIGLGYPFLYLMAGREPWVHLLVAAAVLAGYSAWFIYQPTSGTEEKLVRRYVAEMQDKGKLKKQDEFDQFTGTAARWNKHLNPAATADRWLLNVFPRDKEKEPLWPGKDDPDSKLAKQFWVNEGGYQTLNFVPSFVTMLFGLMAGGLLRSDRPDKSKLLCLALSGLACFAVSLGLDTKMWPIHVAGWDWCYCPAVKRIWTPTWTLYSTGWTLWMLAAFYWIVDVVQWRRWSFPLVVVGMNSIAIYVAAQLIKGWCKQTAKIHLSTLDAIWHDSIAPLFPADSSLRNFGIVPWLFDDTWGELRLSIVVLAMLWLMCYWLYRQKVFIKI
jgi:predicted acyltransferase